MRAAYLYCIFETSLYILWLLPLPRPAIVLGLLVLPQIALYPYNKRWTYWPQLVLGVWHNWGALLGYSALVGSTGEGAILGIESREWKVVGCLWAAGVCWTMVYDTVYAHQDKEDDVKAGIKSTALLFGTWSPQILALSATGMLAWLAAAGYFAGFGPAWYAVGVAGTGVLLARMLRAIDWDDMDSCWKAFNANGWAGGLVAAGAWAEYGLAWSRRA
jgi:4-hydroxybenzoate polyprenyltransferase